MAKYGPGLSSKDACNLDCREASDILKFHNVPRKDRTQILDMIKEGWFQFQQSNEFNKLFTDFVCKHFKVNEHELTGLFFKAMKDGSLL